jgi:hypothetical protein
MSRVCQDAGRVFGTCVGAAGSGVAVGGSFLAHAATAALVRQTLTGQETFFGRAWASFPLCDRALACCCMGRNEPAMPGKYTNIISYSSRTANVLLLAWL